MAKWFAGSCFCSCLASHKFGDASTVLCTRLRPDAPNKPSDFEFIQNQPLSTNAMKRRAAGHREDSLLERAFWSAVTLSPPLYGADTPQSFFDAELEWGWNLRKLQCLLSKRQVPTIPGVNTPMTYFGMWKVRTLRSMPQP